MDDNLYTYSDIRGSGGTWPQTYSFDLYLERPAIQVNVSRRAIEAYTRHVGSDLSARDSHEALATAIQPELAEAAYRKLRLQETVFIDSSDIITE